MNLRIHRKKYWAVKPESWVHDPQFELRTQDVFEFMTPTGLWQPVPIVSDVSDPPKPWYDDATQKIVWNT